MGLTTTISRSEALKQPMLSKEREYELIRRWQEDRDENAIEEIIRAHARIAYKIAASYDKNEEHINDLAQEGILGIIRAAEKFDPGRNLRFSTYAKRWIQTNVFTSTAEIATIVDLPSRVYMKAKSSDANDNPEIKYSAIMASSVVVPLDAPVSDDNETTLMESIRCNRPTPDKIFENKKRQEFFEDKIYSALNILHDRERKIIEMRRLQEPPETLESVAETFEITRERVRQIEVQAMKKIRAHIVNSGDYRTVMEEIESDDSEIDEMI